MANEFSKTLDEALHVPEVGLDVPHEPGIITPDGLMVLLTWITFFSLLGVLYKVAWKPILTALDAREERIRKSLEDARKAEKHLAELEQSRQSKINAADKEAKNIVDGARRAAVEAAKHVEQKARDEAQILLNNAQHEIKAQTEKAQMALRESSVNIAVGLTEKILEEELDAKKQQKLVDRLIKEFSPDEYKK